VLENFGSPSWTRFELFCLTRRSGWDGCPGRSAKSSQALSEKFEELAGPNAAHAACNLTPHRRRQNCFAIPACLSTAFAVWRERIFWSTGKRRWVMGLYQISWSQRPGRSKWHP